MACYQKEQIAYGESVEDSPVDNTTTDICDTGGSGCDVSSTRAEGLADEVLCMAGGYLPSISRLSEHDSTVHELNIRSDEVMNISSGGITQSNSRSNQNHYDSFSRSSWTPCHNTPGTAFVSHWFLMDSRPLSRDPLCACTRVAKVRIALCSAICFLCFVAATVSFMTGDNESDIESAGTVLLIIALVLLSLTLYDATRHQPSGIHIQEIAPLNAFPSGLITCGVTAPPTLFQKPPTIAEIFLIRIRASFH